MYCVPAHVRIDVLGAAAGLFINKAARVLLIVPSFLLGCPGFGTFASFVNMISFLPVLGLATGEWDTCVTCKFQLGESLPGVSAFVYAFAPSLWQIVQTSVLMKGFNLASISLIVVGLGEAYDLPSRLCMTTSDIRTTIKDLLSPLMRAAKIRI